jgi:thiamine biosynthesis lipoprotein
MVKNLILMIITAALMPGCLDRASHNEYVFQGHTMGTRYMVKLAHPKLPRQRLDDVRQTINNALDRLNQQMSPYIKTSEISRFNNHHDTTSFAVSCAFTRVVQEALTISRISEGAFDVTVAPLINLWGFGIKGQRIEPPADHEIKKVIDDIGYRYLDVTPYCQLRKKKPALTIDLSAIAKGFGVDAVAAVIDSMEFKNYLIEIGGEVAAKGVNQTGRAWWVGVDQPNFNQLPGAFLYDTLVINNKAVATSGDYRNFFEYEGNYYSHTIDPVTGRPVTHNLASVTIIADNCMLADGLATAVMVLGPDKGLNMLKQFPGVEALLILREAENRFYPRQTPGFAKYLVKMKK